MTILQFRFPFHGPWGQEMSAALQGLAEDIAAEDGLLWKIWIEEKHDGRAGGIYLFGNRMAVDRYRRKHDARLAATGIRDVAVDVFAVNSPLSRLTHAPLAA